MFITPLPLLQKTGTICDLKPSRNSTPYDVTDNQSVTYHSTLPSLQSLQIIYGEDNSSEPSQTCASRHFHTSVYDPLSDSVWIFGGRESSGRLCDTGLAVVDLSLTLDIARSGNGSNEEERGGLVRWVESSEEAPRGRYSHSAALLSVSEKV